MNALDLPQPVLDVAAALASDAPGASGVWLVGEALHAQLCARPIARFGLATAASTDRVLALFPAAVAVDDGTCFSLPTRAGPVDLMPLREGEGIEDALAARALRVQAMAWSIGGDGLVDPFDGMADVDARLLRTVGPVATRLIEDPVRALQALRYVACDGYALAPELEAGIAELAPPRLPDCSPVRMRRELDRILLADGVERGLALLHSTGVSAALAPGCRADAAAIVAAMPRSLAPRLVAWLAGSKPGRVLRRLRYPLNVSNRVLHLIAHHPIDQGAASGRRTSLQRLAHRLEPEERAALVRLRELEIEAQREAGALSPADADAARDALRALVDGVEAVLREEARAASEPPLALSGGDVMRILGTGPSPRIGVALRHLRERAREQPALNSADALADLLRAWDDRTRAR